MINTFLGIDTSNYTTSIAIVNQMGQVLFDKRIVLTVKPGELGLRQSDAFYQHVMNLPGLFFDVPKEWMDSIEQIGVSCRPRNIDGSYMPVFSAGLQFAKVIAKSLDRPLREYSHQDGHVMAALEPDRDFRNKKIMNLHISGGTTELFMSSWCKEKQYFTTDIIGGTKDISIGQLIDRMGVYLGFPFPAGPSMEASLSKLEPSEIKLLGKLPLKIDGGYFNLSGIENKLKDLHMKGMSSEQLCYLLFTEVGDMLYKLLDAKIKENQPHLLILAGGVMSNGLIRAALQRLVDGYPDLEIVMTPKPYCTDNAVGIAKMALQYECAD